MASLIQIYNGAAVLLGRDPVFTDPARVASSGPTGQALAAAWALIVPAIVAAYPWNFASRRATVPVSATVPASQWTTAHEKPADCLRVRDLNFVPGRRPEKFAVEGNLILDNIPGPASCRYIARILDPAEFDAETAEYSTLRLAAYCALKVTGSAERGGQLGEEARAYLRTLRTNDAQEADEPDDDQDGDWLDFRSRVT